MGKNLVDATINEAKLSIIQGDITQQDTDVIVNAANSGLMGGGGVDGAIHRAAGPQLVAECRTLNGCRTGEAKITKGYKLPATFVIHTVGPVWRGGKAHEAQLLQSCYRHALELALQHDIQTIAFPSISTGIYGFPIQQASRIAAKTVKSFLEQHDEIRKVTFVCFGQHDYQVYQEAIHEVFGD